MSVEVGNSVKGTVLKIADYGAIILLESGQTGLVHISEIADAYVRDVRDYISESDEVRVKVLKINQKGRYELSIKQCPAEKNPMADANERRPKRVTSDKPPASFEDRLTRFMKDSEERLHDLKRHNDARRSR